MEPFVKELSERFAEEIYTTLHERGIDEIPGEGDFCPACREKMTGSVGIIGHYTKPNASLWICMDCAAALHADRHVNYVNSIRNLSFKDKVALVFNGKIPQSWLDEWHKHCKRF